MKKNCCLAFLLLLLVNSLFALDYIWQQKDAEEFINMETHFIFIDANGNNKKEMVYGSTEFGQGDYGFPTFTVGVPLSLNVQMHPTLLPIASGIIHGVRDSEKSKKREITVEITITKSTRIEVTQQGGLTNVVSTPYADGTVTYTFTIKNDKKQHPSISFKFVPAVAGDAQIKVVYYGESPEKKIVSRTCDVFQEIYFKR